jgi:hypothetical protein
MLSITGRRNLVATALVVLGNLVFAGAALAQDAITVASVTADNATVDVPVYIRDAGGTPLGMDQPPASRIQAFSIRVLYSPASAVQSISFSRAGITAGLSPAFETSPSTAGAISLLASFQQSSNPIPFSLNATPPGNQVAHLVVTLSPSTPAGTTITLALDAATTQLTDEGGSAATKETSGNGLSLINGSIHIPVPTLTIVPSSQSVTAGSSALLSAETSERLIGSTQVMLTSSNPAVATVPASATIAAGGHSGPFSVSALSPGSTTITATLPPSAGGATATATITVTQAPQCTTPASPQISGPATALTNETYNITWAAVAGATDYLVDEATDASFTTAVSRTVTTTSASYSHPTANVRYFYRVRARNRAGNCDVTSSPSATISVLIVATPVSATRFLAVVGSTAGSFGSFFKTSLQLYNPNAAAVSGKIVFHTQGTTGSAADPSLAYTLAAGKTLSFADLLPAMGVASGLGSADLISDPTSPLPIALSRVFNDAGAAGTTGLAQESMPATDALQAGTTGALFAPTDMQKFRLNIGVRTLADGVSMTVTVRDGEGNTVKTLSKTLQPTFFQQVASGQFLDGFALTGGETISFTVTSGSAFVYGATTDNTTNDPSVQFARKLD